MKTKAIAIVLGGGRGTRLRPLTSSRSKPAVPVGGKYRLVDIPISNCINSGINRIFVLTQFNSASLNRHIKNSYCFSHFTDSFVDVLAAEQTPNNRNWFEGTADAVRKNMRHIMAYEFEHALILSGDQLYQMDFNLMIDEHTKQSADITIATLPVTSKEAPEFGILKTDSNGLISKFIEKPDHKILSEWESEFIDKKNKPGKQYLASMGIYLFNRNVLNELMKNNKYIDFGKEIIPNAIITHKVSSFIYEGYWTDIGTIKSFFEANLKLCEENSEFKLFNDSQFVYTRARLLPPSLIVGTMLSRSLISDGCIIHAKRIEHSLIGIRSRIGKGTVIEDSIVMGSPRYHKPEDNQTARCSGYLYGIGDRCYINNTIVDKYCSIGDDVIINGGNHLRDFENNDYAIRNGIVVIKRGACIPDGFKLST